MAGKTKKDRELTEQAEKILEIAKKRGVQNNFFFCTTFERYLTQLKILDELRKSIERDGVTTEKSYVKGERNTYANPCVKEFTNTSNSANTTVKTLIKITDSFGKDEDGADELMRFITGEDDEEDE